ncbi:MAG: hypothetical protein R6V02_00890 [Candidatus Aminicenantes bacterium]
MKKFVCIYVTVIFFLFAGTVLTAKADESEIMDMLSGIKARSIGPAGMSGRVAAVEAVISNPNIIYIGAATGGVWKSESGGMNWTPVFDDQPASSIGSIAVFQPNPSIVWVGTGEGNPRNSAGVGYGLFKSLDGGDSWTHLGLEKTECIHRIVLDPENPEIAYVGAMGTAWGENPERGVYKTTDGGRTWKKILFVDEKTGCADLVMDPTNPRKLFAAMWEYRRWPWFFKSGGPGSGLYVTHDGGENWSRITSRDGLPEGELGRMGVAVSRSNPDVVYALVEAEKNALCRSSDGGRTWEIVNDSGNINPRPFYYCDIRVDPERENRIYSLHSRLVVSDDGGRSFDRIASGVHADHHALWINPENPELLINGNDGGVAISCDRGQTWRTVKNLPLAQFYHINIDMQRPYYVYGGMQDNGSWRGPAYTWQQEGIRNYHWINVSGGDGFGVLNDPQVPEIGYSMAQGGYLMRFNLATGETKFIQPPDPADTKLRFNWNAGIAIDPLDPSVLYYGSQFLHKSTDRGNSWSVISPDLTTDDPEKQRQAQSGGLTLDVTAAENHCTILTIAPSPVKKGIIWVGTDDGNVQVTQDSGQTWTNVTENIKGLPPNTWCPHIEASAFDASIAYAVFDDHRRSNWETYVYKTTDMGRTWRSLSRNDPAKGTGAVWGFAHVIREDPGEKNLLFLGTEFGLWVSFNGGNQWHKWTHGIPTAPVRALIVHPRENDLIIGTHGRSAYVIDDIQPLRTLSEVTEKKPLHVFPVPDAYIYHSRHRQGYNSPGNTMFSGENKPGGALVSYFFRPLEKEEKESQPKAAIEILDSSGRMIREEESFCHEGVNRWIWNLRTEGFRYPSREESRERGRSSGPEVVPGRYTVKITIGDISGAQSVAVKADPAQDIPLSSRQEKFETLVEFGKKVEILTEAVDRVKSTQEKIDLVLKQLKSGKSNNTQDMVQKAGDVKKILNNYLENIFGPQDVQGIPDRSRFLLNRITAPMRALSSSYDAPSPADRARLEQSYAALQEALDEFNRIYREHVIPFTEAYGRRDMTLFTEFEPLSLEWTPKKK